MNKKANLNFIKYTKINIPGVRNVYFDPYRNIVISIMKVTDSGQENNNSLRFQINSKKRDSLKGYSINNKVQIIILGAFETQDETIFINVPNDYVLLRTFSKNSSIWLKDKAPILDAYKNNTIEFGNESFEVDTVCFTSKRFEEAMDFIVGSKPNLSIFNESDREINNSELNKVLNSLRDNDEYKKLIGYIGEYIFFKTNKEIKIKNKNISEILWNYDVGNLYENHDFKIKLSNNENRFIEVKSSSPLKESHIISDNEIDFMKKNRNNYSLISVKIKPKMMKYLLTADKINMLEIDDLILKNEYDMEIFNDFTNIEKNFNFKNKTYTLEEK